MPVVERLFREMPLQRVAQGDWQL